MNQERKAEAEHLVDEAQGLIVECSRKIAGDTAKYADTDAWLNASGALSDKITDLLTEQQDAALKASETTAEETPEHAKQLETAEYLETALEDANDAVDALGNEDWEDAKALLEKVVSSLRKAMD